MPLPEPHQPIDASNDLRLGNLSANVVLRLLHATVDGWPGNHQVRLDLKEVTLARAGAYLVLGFDAGVVDELLTTPAECEARFRKAFQDAGFFKPSANLEPFTIESDPTGSLVARKARIFVPVDVLDTQTLEAWSDLFRISQLLNPHLLRHALQIELAPDEQAVLVTGAARRAEFNWQPAFDCFGDLGFAVRANHKVFTETVAPGSKVVSIGWKFGDIDPRAVTTCLGHFPPEIVEADYLLPWAAPLNTAIYSLLEADVGYVPDVLEDYKTTVSSRPWGSTWRRGATFEIDFKGPASGLSAAAFFHSIHDSLQTIGVPFSVLEPHDAALDSSANCITIRFLNPLHPEVIRLIGRGCELSNLLHLHPRLRLHGIPPAA